MDDFDTREILSEEDIGLICYIAPLLVASRTSCGFRSHRPLRESRTRVDGSVLRMCFARKQRSKTRKEAEGEIKPTLDGHGGLIPSFSPATTLELFQYSQTVPRIERLGVTSTRGVELRRVICDFLLPPSPSNVFATPAYDHQRRW